MKTIRKLIAITDRPETNDKINEIIDRIYELALEVAENNAFQHLLNDTWNNLKDMPAPPKHVVKPYCCEKFERSFKMGDIYKNVPDWMISLATMRLIFTHCPFCGREL